MTPTEYFWSISASMVASAIVAFITAKYTVGRQNTDTERRLFATSAKYLFLYKALINEESLQKDEDSYKFKDTDKENVYLQQLKIIYEEIINIFNSTNTTELFEKNLDLITLPMVLSIEIHHFQNTKLISNKSCLEKIFETIEFLLRQKSIQKLQKQKIHKEVTKIVNELNDQYLTRLFGFNPNA